MKSFEIRRYVMQPGRRDELIELFEREFIESQEACGMSPIGHYRDRAHPDTYVWFRGFPDAASRKPALEAFYERSPVWKHYRDAANATLVDSDDVLMLEPLFETSGFDLRGLRRPAPGEGASPDSIVTVAVFSLAEPLSEAARDAVAVELLPALENVARRIAVLVTDDTPNEFPRLPVRSDRVLVFAGTTTLADDLEEWERKLKPRNLPDALHAAVTSAQFFRLEPAARSLYR